MNNRILIHRSTKKDGMPTGNGQYSTNLGYVEVFCGHWMDVNEEPLWWLEEVSLSDLIGLEPERQVVLPEAYEDETFMENEISYQHHGVVRGAIANYKIWLMNRKNINQKK